MPDHVCPHCGVTFYSRKSTQKFCGNPCRYAAASVDPNTGTFQPGERSSKRLAVGTVRVRERRKRTEGPRAWVKVAEPNVWRLRAVVAWEAEHGPLPPSMIVHHRNRDTLDDSLPNLEAVTRADHLAEHRPEFEAKRAQAAAKGRWGR
jgi:hypothetical protein